MALGPIMLNVDGYELTTEDRELLSHPLVGGIILFTRNYHSPDQVIALTQQIRRLRKGELLIAVDQEGGRVQRFQEGFTALPSLSTFGQLYDRDLTKAKQLAEQAAWLMATEILAVGIDFSFAPVLDLAWGTSEIIGSRSFHRDPNTVADLGASYIQGMRRAGMAATGKHFPGHGYVVADSHVAVPVDERDFATIEKFDVVPFQKLIAEGLAGIMPAHIIYEQVEPKPAGFSAFWLQEILRQRLGFQGVIFSDDLSMAGAEYIGNYTERAEQALATGCDMILVCNNRQGAISIIDNLKSNHHALSEQRLAMMHGHAQCQYADLKMHRERLQVIAAIHELL